MSDIFFYVHIPFCYRKCPYCAFVSFEKSFGFIDSYIEALLKEINSFVTDNTVKTVYFGGGTPTTLNQRNIEMILNAINKRFKTDLKEITIETIPLRCKKEYFKDLKLMGINRISIGIQSFIDWELEKLGRLHTSKDNIKCLETIFNSGFDNVNVDFIYGVGESKEDLKRDIKYLKNFPVKHVSTYMLSLERNTLFFNQKDNLMLSNDEELSDFYLLLCEELPKMGFMQYEISNFSKPGYRSIHNTAYWKMLQYKGFGVSASSFLQNKRIKNTDVLSKYIKDPKSSCTIEEVLDDIEFAKEMLILGLRQTDGVSINKIKRATGVNVYSIFKETIDKFEELGYLKKRDDKVTLTGCKAFLVSNTILSEFV